jgi:8-oxo-dGTP pyrophosphatase MutT (NUDIX family)
MRKTGYGMISSIFRAIHSLFYRPNLLQVAALCWRKHKGEPQVLLIRSLHTNRWIIPKGWPMPGKTLAEAAEIEAWEEAGVKGQISSAPIGSFHYQKERGSGIKQPCDAQVFSLQVSSLAAEFPESDLRNPQWFSVPDATRRVLEPELQALIRSYLAQTP